MIARGVAMKTRWTYIILFILLFPFLLASGEEKTHLVMTAMPEGDVAAGRKAFLDLSCHTCHNVSSDPALGTVKPEASGPDLSKAAGRTTQGYQTTSIIAPSHIIIYEYWRKEQKQSPMPDLTRAMTVRQLIDLIAYLQSFEKRNTD
jgi:mono/diheme cytochrome c family protein